MTETHDHPAEESTGEGAAPKVTCYADGEARFMQRSQEVRGALLRPLLEFLARSGITASHLTLLSLIAGVAFVPFFLWGLESLALVMLLVHVALDGIDGPLARHTGKASNRGSFTDTTADQVVVATTTITLIHAGAAGAWPGGTYLFLYTVVVIFAMVRNALAIPYSWVLRPRFGVYAWIPVELYVWPGTLDLVLWIVSPLLALKMLTGFLKIRRRI